MKFFGMLLLAGSLQAATIQVPTDQPTIQAGITAALPGDTVLIADGTYTGEGNYNIDLLGKAITVKSANGPGACILDAQGAGRLFTVTSGEDTAVIAGLTLRNGTAEAAGGAISCLQSALAVRDCRIESSSAPSGGGLYVEQGAVVMTGCRFRLCQAGARGGAIHAQTANLTLAACHFDSNNVANTQHVFGGALSVGRDCQAALDSCTFVGNYVRETQWVTGYQFGGAIVCDSGSTLSLTLCQFVTNGSEGTAGGAVYSYGSQLAITACRFESNGQLVVASPKTLVTIPQDTTFGSPRHPSSGGALYLKGSSVQVSGSVFARNGITCCAFKRGGAAVSENSIASFAGCTFVGNFGSRGQALYVDSSTVTVDSCIVALHTSDLATAQPVEFHPTRPSQIMVSCSDVYGNQQGDWVGVLDTLANKYSNFSLDPQFCRKSIANYQLQEDSPCRPEASPCGSLVGALPVAPDCNSCCEGTTGNVDMKGIIDLQDLSRLIAYLYNPTGTSFLPCKEAGNVNTTGYIDLADLSLLVAYLVVPAEQRPVLPWCL